MEQDIVVRDGDIVVGLERGGPGRKGVTRMGQQGKVG